MDGESEEELRRRAADGVEALIRLSGYDPAAPLYRAAPRSAVAAFTELAARPDPAEAAAILTPDVDAGPRVTVVEAGPEPVLLVCPAHLLPYRAQVWIAHRPGPDGTPVTSQQLTELARHLGRGIVSGQWVTQAITHTLGHLAGIGAACCVTVPYGQGCPACPPSLLDVHTTGIYREIPEVTSRFLAWVQGEDPGESPG